jgi:hypothetical protein
MPSRSRSDVESERGFVRDRLSSSDPCNLCFMREWLVSVSLSRPQFDGGPFSRHIETIRLFRIRPMIYDFALGTQRFNHHCYDVHILI